MTPFMASRRGCNPTVDISINNYVNGCSSNENKYEHIVPSLYLCPH